MLEHRYDSHYAHFLLRGEIPGPELLGRAGHGRVQTSTSRLPPPHGNGVVGTEVRPNPDVTRSLASTSWAISPPFWRRVRFAAPLSWGPS